MKTLFGNSLSDTPNVAPCKSREEKPEEILPEKFDWREKYPECVQNVTL